MRQSLLTWLLIISFPISVPLLMVLIFKKISMAITMVMVNMASTMAMVSVMAMDTVMASIK